VKSITSIDKFKEGDSIQGFFLCFEKHIRHSRNGDLFIDLRLRDKTGSINAKIWDNVNEVKKKFNSGDPVAVSGIIELFMERPHLIIKKINRASVQYYGRYGYDPSLIVPSSKKKSSDMWKSIVKIIRSMNSTYLRRLVSMVYKENKEIIMTHPATVNLHYNYRSGFIEHILSMAKIAEQLIKHYKVDRDLLLSGIFLHDIGRLVEITSDLESNYSDEGKFIGHIILGRDIVRATSIKIKNFPKKIQTRLEHLIISEDSKYKWDNKMTPKIPEALLLQLIKNIDSKMNLFTLVIDESSDSGTWTDTHNIFRASLFKGSNDSK
jgi:3'-5' exoribonuclease|tara:strand:+ start:329 stop:1294 length:966 start_codon:yes stop_codon:yes gene_type:complete